MKKKINKWIRKKITKRQEVIPRTYYDVYKEIKRIVKNYIKIRREFMRCVDWFRAKGMNVKIDSEGLYLFVLDQDLAGRDPVSVCREISNLLTKYKWNVHYKWRYNTGSIDGWFIKDDIWFKIFIDMNDTCELEDIEETIIKKRMVGLCSKALESINESL